MSRKIILTGLILFLSVAVAQSASPGKGHAATGGVVPLEQLRQELHLTPAQEQAWQQISAQADASRARTQDNWIEIVRVYKSELDKPEPDLARVASLVNQTQDQQAKELRDIQQKRLVFYTNLTPEQKSIVKEVLKQRLAGIEERWKEDDDTESALQ
jgi:Spy/CpxP family protein refolding chaperone